MKVVLDTNFLLLPNQFGVDIFEYLKYFEPVIFSSCFDELKKLSRTKTKDGLAARIGLQLLKENNVHIIKTKEKCDSAILNYTAAEGCAVATNDKVLIKALKIKGVKIIRLKQKKYLVDE